MLAATPLEPVKVLTIAGSDSGGAAGLQADLKTFTVLGAYGMSVITAVTAQNSLTVANVHWLPASFVAQQLEVVLADYGAVAIKTGFIGRADTIQAIAPRLAEWKAQAGRSRYLVVDPVLVNHRGEAMFGPELTAAYQAELFPLADLVTPNLAELSLLSGIPVSGLVTMEGAARAVQANGPAWVLATGGRSENQMVDLLLDGQQARLFHHPVYNTQNTHGSGDTLSAAASVYLSRGATMPGAVEKAGQWTAAAIRGGRRWRLGGGHGPVSSWGGDLPAIT